ncbi:helix-turn-helix domain-containing protein [Microbacterium lacus]|uniref:helix-turn-helix domain-containing protein n=1 Tax=Microbacterium lacus TaxID=415217 RepID=UPI00384FF295
MTANVEIGQRLRDARTRQGISLRAIAQAVGVSPSLISQVETGKTQPSVSTLYALVNQLGISLDELMGHEPWTSPPTKDAPGPMLPYPPSVQRAGKGPTLEMENGVRWERLAIGADGMADAFLATYEPSASSSVEGKLMRHAGIEYGYIIEGELTLQLEFDTQVLGPGDSLHFDSARPHLYVNNGTVPARGVWFVVGRRQAGSSTDDASTGAMNSAVDVLRAMDQI